MVPGSLLGGSLDRLELISTVEEMEADGWNLNSLITERLRPEVGVTPSDSEASLGSFLSRAEDLTGVAGTLLILPETLPATDLIQ